MTRYTVLTTSQLAVLTLMMGLVAGGLGMAGNMYRDYALLPQVVVGADGACIKVLNVENGHAFTCPDVGVLLRRYRKVEQ